MRLFFFSIVLFSLAGCAKKEEMASRNTPKREGPTRQQILGRELYAHYCSHCHGSEGQGDGLNAYNLKVKPPDFSSPKFQRSRSNAAIEKFIELGGHKSGKSVFCPEWGKTLSARKITYLRHYLRIFANPQ